MHRLLIIDDDEKLVALLREYLEPQGFELLAEHDGERGLRVIEAAEPDLVILDLMLPGIDGLEVCRRVRRTHQVPILMLTARGDETDRIVGLELGADDYLPKPFNPRELMARIRAVLRRMSRTEGERPIATELHAGALTVDPGARTVTLEGRMVELTTVEFDLLRVLVEQAGRVLSREQLLERVHGQGWASYDRSVDVHISRIRQKLGDNPKHPNWLKTVRGVGYLLNPKAT